MEEMKYTISEASKQLGLETHVLRYWEEELELDIARNQVGHRYYTKDDMTLFENVKLLKEQGLQLKAIKMALPNMDIMKQQYEIQTKQSNTINIADPNNEKVKQFQMMMKSVLKEALTEYNQVFKEELKHDLRHELSEEMKLFTDRQEQREKERFRKLDETLREVQTMRKEMAAASEKAKKPWYKSIINK